MYFPLSFEFEKIPHFSIGSADLHRICRVVIWILQSHTVGVSLFFSIIFTMGEMAMLSRPGLAPRYVLWRDFLQCAIYNMQYAICNIAICNIAICNIAICNIEICAPRYVLWRDFLQYCRLVSSLNSPSVAITQRK